ncbi:hypothetical protein GLOTRDRAFT_60477 [Gloeophyllum trabeum ATCC 11539]|uniref:Uncharacterized protein n=1 Tax=Gloeophyllum trabeum (strain ATCC 11539 / FP-39264 / Madison 617) TaxID=670483 RepID=S7RMP5_GLOTA|nr:uncharacterized protein GLOTRDRAFT_60477 [Gloeophyllum trabeum ATCC 11539]EPQ55730.1 hypothetical protein GLOTRDRAFT_60477 [Gloeophyllum trabeum ATCC 11539]
MLPTHQGHDGTALSRYTVQSSDVISDMRVNVIEESSQKVMWYKERFLTDDEIVEHIYDNATTTLCWSVHRPKRGWYIRIRCPSFPPGYHIGLTPVPKTSPYHSEAALCFSCRTNVPRSIPALSDLSSPRSPQSSVDTDITLTEAAASSSTALHSYPPTPPIPAVSIRPPSPGHEDDPDQPRKSLKSKAGKPKTQVSQFLLSRHTQSVAQPASQQSFLTRALSLWKTTEDAQSLSFTLSPVPAVTPHPSAPGPSGPGMQCLPHMPPPLVQFHDRTPAFAFRSTTGMLEIDEGEARVLGVQVSFWVTVALTYLGFLEDRDSYLAALSD